MDNVINEKYNGKIPNSLLKNNGVTTIGADEQLTEKNIMKLTDLIKEHNLVNLKPLKEQGFDDRLKTAGGFSDEEMDDITSRDIGSPFPGTDEVSNGYKAAVAFIDEFREITYKKMSQEEIDTFSKEMVLHFLEGNTTAQATAKLWFGKKEL